MKHNPAFKAVLIFMAFLLTFGLQAQVFRPFQKKYETRVRGNMTMISNNILNRYNWNRDTEDPYNGDEYNDDLEMRYINIDSDGSTFSSSSATLSISDSDGCYKILYAALYWSGTYPFEDKDHTNVRHAIDEVKLKLPGESVYRDIEGEVIFDGYTSGNSSVTSNSPYACYADITSYITSLSDAEGEYTVANVRAAEGQYKGFNNFTGGSSAGWTIFLVYEDLSLPARFITSFDGFSWVRDQQSVDVPVSGFRTNPTGQVRADLMTIALEGDQELAGDSFYLNSDHGYHQVSDNINPGGNYFNSKISKDGQQFTDRIPNSRNTLGYDANIVRTTNFLNNDETDAILRFNTDGDSYYPFFTAFSAEIVMPDIRMVKSIRNEVGADISNQEVALGSKIYYHIDFENIGNDHASDFTIRDLLPVNARADVAVEDLSDGISYQHDEESGELLFTIEDTDGEFKAGAEGRIVISVSVEVDCDNYTAACSHIIRNQAFATYTGVESGMVITEDPSLSGVDACNMGEQVPVNFLADTATCTYEREEILCSGQLELVAGDGFASYTWTNSAGNVIGNTQTVTVNAPGVYTVFKEATDESSCPDMEETITVVLHGDVQENPLLDVADEVQTCTDDGSLLPKFFLCGAGERREVTTNLDGATSIVWEKLEENGACGTADRDAVCANRSSSCTWQTVAEWNRNTDGGNGSTYGIGEHGSGQYRMVVTYSGGCFSRFYFNVYTNDLAPTLYKEDILCGDPGMLRVEIVSSDYEYRWFRSGTALGDWTDDNFYAPAPAEGGLYRVEIRQKDVEGGCIFELEATVLEKDMEVEVTTTPISPNCVGGAGSIRVRVSGVNGNYTYRLFSSPTGGTVLDETGPSPNSSYYYEVESPATYYIEVTAENGNCTFDQEVVVEGLDELDLQAHVEQHISCSQGMIRLTASGGSAPYFYAITEINGAAQNPVYPDNYQPDPDFYLEDGGIYRFEVVDDNGCPAWSGTVELEEFSPLPYTVSPHDVSCFGADDGRIGINYTPDNFFTLSYLLQDGNGDDVTGMYLSGDSFEDLPPGDYTLTVTQSRNGSSCDPEVHEVTITAPDTPLTASSEINEAVDCDPVAGGQSRIVHPEGGTPPYEYSFDGGVNYGSNNEGYLLPGNHHLHVRDDNGCVYTMEVNVPEPLTPPGASVVVGDYDCEGNAEATVQLTGQDPGYLYWYEIDGVLNVPDSTSNVFSGVGPGDHTVTVNYATDPLLPGQCPGSISLPLSIDYNRSFSAGITNVRPVSCHDATTTRVDFFVRNYDTATGFEYSIDGGTTWLSATSSPVSVNNVPVDTAAGEVSLLVRYAGNECELHLSEAVEIPDPVTASFSVIEEATCNTGAGIRVTASGGVAPYEFRRAAGSWSEPGASAEFYNMPAGIHPIEVRDVNGCTSVIDVAIDAPLPLTFETEPLTCYAGDSNGRITVNVTGGNGNYRFRINTGEWRSPVPADGVSYEFTGLTSGSYIIQVEDGSGCRETSGNIIIHEELTATVNAVDINCAPGSIGVTPSGGAGGYIYAFVPAGSVVSDTDFSTDASYPVNPGADGDYDIYVRDNNGAAGFCEYSETVTIARAPVLAITADADSPQCYGETGAVEVRITSGEGPFDIVVSDEHGDPVSESENFIGTVRKFTNIPGGAYTVGVTDRYGCVEELAVTVNEPDELTATLVPVLPEDCDETDPAFYGMEFRDVPNYPGLTVEFSVDNGLNWTDVPVITGYASGTVLYPSMRTVDASGNTVCRMDFEDPFTVPYPPMSLVISAEAELNGCDFQVTVEGEDGIPPYEFSMAEGGGDPVSWVSTGSDTYVFTGLLPGKTYAFYVRDATGCVRVNDVDIYDEFDIVDTQISYSRIPACFGESNGSIAFEISDGDGSHETRIRWELFDTDDNPVRDSGGAVAYTPPMTLNVENLAPGEYYLLVTQVDNAGDDACYGASENVLIREAAEITIRETRSGDINCNNPGYVEVQGATGGWGGYTYRVSGANLSETISSTENIIQIPYDKVINPSDPVSVDIEIEDQYGCSALVATEVLSVAQHPVIAAVVTDNCQRPFGMEIQAVNGSGSYSYSIDGGATYIGNGGHFENLAPGTYQVQVIDSNGCVSAPETVEIYPAFEAAVEPVKPLDCSDDDPDARITITASGGSGNYEYEITGDATVPRTSLPSVPFTFSVAAEGDYTVHVYDVKPGTGSWTSTACDVSTDIHIAAPKLPEVIAATTDVSCYAANDGTIRLTETDNGILPLSYILNPMPAGASPMADGKGFENLPPGNYSIRATGTNDCVVEITDIIIQQPAAIAVPPAAIAVTPFSCSSGNSPGEAVVHIDVAQISGGSGTYVNYEFIQQPGGVVVGSGTSATLTWADHSGGQFTVNVYDDEGCAGTQDFEIAPFDRLEDAWVVATDADCNMGATVSPRAITTAGNLGRIEWSLDDGDSNPDNNSWMGYGDNITDLPPGAYVFLIRHRDTGCMLSVHHSVPEPEKFGIDVRVLNDVICPGTESGRVAFEMTETSYSGIFEWEIFNAGDDTSTGISGTHDSDNGETPAVSVGGGSFYVMIRQQDAPYCSVRKAFGLAEPPGGDIAAETTVNITRITCDEPTGSVHILASGGWGGYRYYLAPVWQAAPAESDFTDQRHYTGLSPDTYQLWIRDTGGCVVRLDNVELSSPDPIHADIAVNPGTELECIGDFTAEVIAQNITGGSGNYQFRLNYHHPDGTIDQTTDGGPSLSFPGLGAGMYSITVEDDWGCSYSTGTVTVTEPPAVTASVGMVRSLGCTEDALVEISVSGGRGGPYVYSENYGGPYVPVSDFEAGPGTYAFYVREDGSSCEPVRTNELTISPIPALTISLDLTAASVNCNGQHTAVIRAAAGGGRGNYSYVLLDEHGDEISGSRNSTGSFTGIAAGNYYVRVDSEDCSEVSGAIEVEEPDPLSVAVDKEDVLCYGGNNGSITIMATGGTGGMKYAISTNPKQFDASGEFDGLTAGTYTVIAQDSSGCFEQVEVTIDEPDAPLSVTLGHTAEICEGDENGTITVSVSGGTGPYYTSLNNRSSFAEGVMYYDALAGGRNHAVYVRDANGCETSAVVFVEAGVQVAPSVAISYGYCSNSSFVNEVEVSIADPAEVGRVRYSLDGGAPVTGNVFADLAPGTHTVEVIHNNGCRRSTDFEIVEQDILNDLRVTALTDVVCYGEATGSVTVQASGGQGVVRYAIQGKGGFQTSGVFDDLEAGNYTVVARDERGCELSVDIVISQPAPLNVQLLHIRDEVCAGDRDAEVSVSVSGGTPPYASSLNNRSDFVNGRFDFSGLSGEEDNVIYIRDAAGCEYVYEVPLAAPVNMAPVVHIRYECEGVQAGNQVTVEVDPAVSGQVMYSLDGAPSQLENSYAGLEPGEHMMEVTHANGCVQHISFRVEDIAPLQLRLEVNRLNEITAVVSGGTAPYHYAVNGNSLGERNTYRVNHSANYTVSVTDANGCTLSSDIAMDFVDIEIPNVFTPNGDGYEDTWKIKNAEAYPDMKVIIYDRYGRELVKLPPGAGWDGIYKGSLLPTGDYWYTLKLNGENDNREFVGHFTLYR
ncbi:T9SS type B sorting domain-containing protein [Sinomicrobium soli]|uniref:T9SS type B sorting domain-containing protein n=1 Tax=Sinomicrobium sp. N-1-3-6 TaxID=2219864 RepID=UPI001374BF06|nr:T9SS type B sorting domain-containing protein [Sinomicrobium sp. N-1-3-6]